MLAVEITAMSDDERAFEGHRGGVGVEVREITAAARELLERSVMSCADEELTEEIRECETAMRTLLAVQLERIAEADRRSLATRHGARNTKSWLQRMLRLSGGEATTRVKVARKVCDRADDNGTPLPPALPATADALRAGALGLGHAHAVVDGLRRLAPLVSPQQHGEAETQLVEQARILNPTETAALAERTRYYYAPDSALRDEEYQIDARELHVVEARDGMTVLKGRLDRETGAKLRAALEPLAAPRTGDDGQKDPRTPWKRNADAFADLLDIALATDRLPRAGGQRPHLTVTIDFDGLRRQMASEAVGAVGTIDNTGQPVTAAQVRRWACDAEVLPIVLGGDSQPLDVGRAERTAPPHLRAALLARDGDCAFPGCDHPAGTSEAHHIQSWIDGGPTSIDNMIMLCAAHHRIVHSQRWEIELASGRPVFVPAASLDPGRRPRPGGQPARRRDILDLSIPAQRPPPACEEAIATDTDPGSAG